MDSQDSLLGSGSGGRGREGGGVLVPSCASEHELRLVSPAFRQLPRYQELTYPAACKESTRPQQLSPGRWCCPSLAWPLGGSGGHEGPEGSFPLL